MKRTFILLELALALLVVANVDFAQSNSIPRDTSFTIKGTAVKVVSQFPHARLVDSRIPSTVKQIKNIVYASYGKRSLHLDLFMPKSITKALPAVVIIHGGGWRSGERTMEWPTAIFLAQQGYVAATVEYRLSPEAKYPAAVFDIKSSIKWLRRHAEQYNIDKEKIAISGCSSGGELAVFIGVTNSDKKFEYGKKNSNFSSEVQAIIDVDGILDFTDPAESGKDTIASKPSAGKAWLGESYKQNPNIWIEASPIHHVNKNCPPICFINSSLTRFHTGRDSMVTVLNKYGVFSETHTISNTPHPFWLFHPWFEKTTDIMKIFLEKIFGNKREI